MTAALGGDAAFDSFVIVRLDGRSRVIAPGIPRANSRSLESNLWPLWSVMELRNVVERVILKLKFIQIIQNIANEVSFPLFL